MIREWRMTQISKIILWKAILFVFCFYVKRVTQYLGRPNQTMMSYWHVRGNWALLWLLADEQVLSTLCYNCMKWFRAARRILITKCGHIQHYRARAVEGNQNTEGGILTWSAGDWWAPTYIRPQQGWRLGSCKADNCTLANASLHAAFP